MNYLNKRKIPILFCLFLCISYNLYFVFLLPHASNAYLYYLDFLLAVCILCYGGVDYLQFKKLQNKKEQELKSDALIYQEFSGMENYDIAEHDVEVLQNQLREQFDYACDLSDYIAKWCHEVKIPLSASLLMNERIEDTDLRYSMKEQLEKINSQLKDVLLGCKIQSSLFDIQMKRVSLLECVKTSIKNNQFFLIRNHFQIEIDVENRLVYTDKNWLVYILDQLISNAIKYAMEDARLRIFSRKQESGICLFVEDHGEGIAEQDIRRIFDKGYTGSSHHNGKYKSTGMGLYMTKKIAEKLGHTISVESEKGKYTRFMIEIVCQ